MAIACASAPWISGVNLKSGLVGAGVGAAMMLLTRSEIQVEPGVFRFRNIFRWRIVRVDEVQGWVIGRDRLYLEVRPTGRTVALAATVTLRLGQANRTQGLVTLLRSINAVLRAEDEPRSFTG